MVSRVTILRSHNRFSLFWRNLIIFAIERYISRVKVTESNSDSYDWMTHSTNAILYSPPAKWDVLNFFLNLIRLSTFKNFQKNILAPKISISPKSMGNETSSSVGFGSLHGGRETPSSIVSDTEQIFQLQVIIT